LDRQSIDIKNWDDYWNIFRDLCAAFQKNNRSHIEQELIEARLHVNGMTDGWYEFLELFEKSMINNKDALTKNELEVSGLLIKYVKDPLTKR